MAVYRDTVQVGGRTLAGASVTVYTENTSVAAGAESSGSFVSPTIYSERTLTTAKTNPLTTDSLGQFEFYLAAGSLVALKVTRTGYGTKWIRNVDVNGTDPT